MSVGSILRWNQLDPNRPQFWVGEQLRIQTQIPDRRRIKLDYVIRPNDTWDKIARRFSVDVEQLQRFWNPRQSRLQAGHQLTVWVEPGTYEQDSIEEPRFVRRNGPRTLLDYTRLTQNGRYSGWIEVDGVRTSVDGFVGTRDRSWGVRHRPVRSMRLQLGQGRTAGRHRQHPRANRPSAGNIQRRVADHQYLVSV